MKILKALIKRNTKLFFKDKGMFFTALITPAILLVLYATFLGNVYRDSFTANLPQQIGISEKLIIDFSVVNDMNYYNGIAFKGFVYGIPVGILSGGEYDGLLKKMQKNEKGIGFAVYLDELSRLGEAKGATE